MPDNYTIREYMLTTLSTVGEALGWGISSPQIVEAVTDVELVIDLDHEDVRAVRAVARREVWKAAVGALSAYYDFRSDQEHFSRSQMLAGAEKSLAMAESDCDALGFGSAQAFIHDVEYRDDPYTRTVVEEVA